MVKGIFWGHMKSTQPTEAVVEETIPETTAETIAEEVAPAA